MRYIVHNKQLIEDLKQQVSFDTVISDKISLLERVLSNYRKHLVLDIYISKTTTFLLKVSVSIKMKSKLIYLEDEGDNPLALVGDLLEKLRNIVKKQLAKEKKEHLYKRKFRRTETFAEYAQKLDEFYFQKDRQQFNHLITELIPALRTYILRYLKTHGHDIKLILTIQEIIDEVYIFLFDKFNERPALTENITSWVYSTAKEYLDKMLSENTVKNEQMDISMLAAMEIKSFEEKFTAGADGELIMLEDLDDISYLNEHYGHEIFPEDALIDHPEIHPLSEDIKEALENCEEKEKMIFEMYWLDELSKQEIGNALGMNVNTIKKIIKNVTDKVAFHVKKIPSEYKRKDLATQNVYNK